MLTIMIMKKLLLFIFTLLLPLVASADAYNVKIDGICYNLFDNDKTAEVTSSNPQYSGYVIIPETVTYNDNQYSVTSIGEKAFKLCTGLRSITIPNSVKSIGEEAFAICYGLIDIIIPNRVTSIGDGAFYNCYGLIDITISNRVTSIGNYVFTGCDRLKSITIPNSVTSIGDYAFYRCSGLTSVTISNRVTSIGDKAFSGCFELTSITIPNSVTSIGDGAFDDRCSSLNKVYCYATNLPKTRESAFGNYVLHMTLYVPASAINKYKASAPWSWFGKILPIEEQQHK